MDVNNTEVMNIIEKYRPDVIIHVTPQDPTFIGIMKI